MVMRKNDIKDRVLAELSFAGGFTKMVAFWESPFQAFLHIDSDIVLWGDITKSLHRENVDFIHNSQHEEITHEILISQYFDPDKLFRYTRSIKIENKPFFNSGIYFARKGILDRDQYIKLLTLKRDCPETFRISWEQGILNYMVYERAEHEGLRVSTADLQTIVPSSTETESQRRNYLENRFKWNDSGPVVDQPPTTIHWAGPKPWPWNKTIYSEAMTYWVNQSLIETKHPLRLFRSHAYTMAGWTCLKIPRKLAAIKDYLRIRTRIRKLFYP